MQAPTPLTTSTPPTRAELLRIALGLKRAAGILEAHANRCPVEQAPAHDLALRHAMGVVRSVLMLSEPGGEEEEHPAS